MSKKSGKISYQKGQWAEQLALEYLIKHQLKLLDKNYRSPFGEIDLIMQDQNTLVFIEVRYRSNQAYHSAIESIDQKKCQRIIATSHQYLSEKHKLSRLNCRFDIVALSGQQQSPKIEWIKNAFQA